MDVLAEPAVARRVTTLRRSVDHHRRVRDLAVRTATTSEAEGEDPERVAGERAEAARLGLVLEREGLRLQFLTQPLERRRAAIEAERERRLLAVRAAAAAVERAAAEAEAAAAERARLEAVEAARVARDEAERAIAAERAKAAEARAGLAEARGALAEDRAELARRSAERLALEHAAEARLAESSLSALDASALYDQVVAALELARRDLRIGLIEHGGRSALPDYVPGVDVDAAAYRKLALERDELLRSIEAVETARAALEPEERLSREERVAQDALHVRSLDRLRLELLPRLPQGRRERLLGIGPDGLQELFSELDHLRLLARLYVVEWSFRARGTRRWLTDLVSLSSKRWSLLQLMLLSVGALVAHRRRAELFAAYDHWLLARAVTRQARRRVAALGRSLRAIAVHLGFLVVAVLGFAVLEALMPSPELELARGVVVAAAVYRLVQGAAHGFFLSATWQVRRTLDAELSQRILSTLRIAGRYALFVWLFLFVSERVTGRGYLYLLVQDTAWLGGFPIAVVLLRRWRPDVETAYARVAPGTALAGAMERARGRWIGLLVMIPAVVHLAIDGALAFLRNVAMSFDRTRKTLAFLFRRSLEKAQTGVLRGERNVEALPPALRHAFEATEDEALWIDHFPHLEKTRAALARWRGEGIGFAHAVVGARGCGRTTWLERLRRVEELDGPELAWIRLDGSFSSAPTLLARLGAAVGAPEASDVEALVAALESGPPRLIVIDEAENMVLRSVRGTRAYEAFAQVVRRTVHRIGWVAAFRHHGFAYLEYVLPGQSVFGELLRLPRWTEDQVEDAIERRMEAAGATPVYDDLLSESARRVDREAELSRTRERFLRLLWDYSDGRPGFALRFWLRSLVAEGGSIRVRLFDAPDADALEPLREQARFVLNAVVQHGDLALDEVAEVLEMPSPICLAVLEQLRALGPLERRGVRYHVRPGWALAAERYLRRKHLVHV